MKNNQPAAAGAGGQPDRLTEVNRRGSLMGGGSYEIKVEGHLDEHWAEWLGGLAIAHGEEGYTLLTGFIPDQAALHGILVQIRDLGLLLISLNRIEIGEEGSKMRVK